MFDFLIRKSLAKSTQKYIEGLQPKVNLHVPEDLPIPSINALKQLSKIVSEVNGFEEKISQLSDDELRAKTKEFKVRYEQQIKTQKEAYLNLYQQYRKAQNLDNNEVVLQYEKARDEFRKTKKKILDDILPEAFAVVRETGKRVLRMRHFDVQLVGGMVLHNGNIAEMTTGEGKTLMATLPAYLNALTGEGVHVITVNDYLAGRDRDWMGPIYEFLGLTVGVIQHDMTPSERQRAYGCDITYGTNNEFGFDYLRDNMVSRREDMVQREYHFAIVDEVDSILIDEARTPLIISGPAEESTNKYYRANEIVKQLKGRRITEKDEIDAKHKEIDLTVGFDYMADEKNKTISITDAGEEKAAKLFGIDNLHEMHTIEYRHHILQALRAKEFFKNDVDYVVKEGQVIIVDEFTGRLMPGRRWSDGLHQAVEAMEGIKIERENQTLATITFQNYFRMYEKLAGMTGTAYTEAAEFKQIYNLDCMAIPTNKRLQRINYPDSIYKTEKEKFDAVVKEIEELNVKGRPILVGTISIEKSEFLSSMLKRKAIAHQVLNAKFHEQEANIIAQAGRFKGVTIATNMAGRGTDIVLGGNAEFLAKNLAENKIDKNVEEKVRDEMIQRFVEQFREQTKKEHDEVVQLGGLHVLGTERHESRRIDNQLRGRQGRQGDPGSSRFYISLQDDLMRLFASDKIIGLMDKLGMEEGQVLEHPWLNKALENAQKRVENHNFEIRKHLLEYDNVMNRQREVIYGLRRSILESDDVKYLIINAISDLAEIVVGEHLSSESKSPEESTINVEALEVFLKTTFGYDIAAHREKIKTISVDEAKDFIKKEILSLYEAKEQLIGLRQLRFMERMLLLHTIDSKWKDHLYAMDQLKEGVGLRSYGQRDPLLEYKREGFQMFQGMYDSIFQEVAETIFKIVPVTQGKLEATDAALPKLPKSVFSSIPQKLIHNEISGMMDVRKQSSMNTQSALEGQQPTSAQKPTAPIRNDMPKVGPNDPCPCGSGKKYKKCCRT